MTHQEAFELTTDRYNKVATPYPSRGDRAHPATCPTILPDSEQPRQRPGTMPQPIPFPAGEKLEGSTGVQEREFRTSSHTLRSPREIAAVSVRVAILAGIIWFVLVWTGIAAPTQKYQEYTIDFSSQLLVRGRSSLLSTFSSVIPSAPLQLALRLGRENEPGTYSVALVQDGMRYAFASGIAKLENHELILRVKMDFSQTPGGESQLGIRPTGEDWRYYKVIVKPIH